LVIGHLKGERQLELRETTEHSSTNADGQVAGSVAEPTGVVPRETLAWGRHFLPAHFIHPPSAMQCWLGWQLDGLRNERGVKINVIGPRGSAKSTVVTFCYVLQAAVEGREPYIWIVSDTSDQARLHLDNLRTELSDNKLMAKQYGTAMERGRHWRSAAIQLSNEVTIESFGTGQGLRGRRRRAARPTLIVCDDLQNDSHIASAAQREASRRWFHGTLLNAGTPTTNVVNLATALHRDALALQLAQTPGWTSESFGAIQKWPRNRELWREWQDIYCDVDNPDARHAARAFYERHRAEMDDGAVLLWPEVENLYTLMRLRVEIGHTAFDREKQGLPVNPEMCEWPDEYFEDHIWFDAWPSKFKVRVIALDPSKGRDAARGDYSAFVLVGIDDKKVIYVEADMARRPTPRMVADGVALCRRFRPHVFGIEANQYQELLCTEFRAELSRRNVEYIEPIPIHNTVSKIVRIRTLGPLLAQQTLRFLRMSQPTRMLVEQLRDFPCGAHDDGPDALEMALRLAGEWLNKRVANDGLGRQLPVES
jgi:predicted phage terminase large subunit-like protein